MTAMAAKRAIRAASRGRRDVQVDILGENVLPGIGGRLQSEQARIAAVESHQLLVRSLFDQAAVLQEQDSVGAADRREAMRDVDGGAGPRQRVDAFEELVLRPG